MAEVTEYQRGLNDALARIRYHQNQAKSRCRGVDPESPREQIALWMLRLLDDLATEIVQLRDKGTVEPP